jgi:hypothetical protein
LRLSGAKPHKSDEARARDDAEHPHRILLAANKLRVLVIGHVYTWRDEILFNAARSEHATSAFALIAFFIIKLRLIYHDSTAVLDQRRQSHDTLGHSGGDGQDILLGPRG